MHFRTDHPRGTAGSIEAKPSLQTVALWRAAGAALLALASDPGIARWKSADFEA